MIGILFITNNITDNMTINMITIIGTFINGGIFSEKIPILEHRLINKTFDKYIP